MKIILRPGTTDDLNFITSSWFQTEYASKFWPFEYRKEIGNRVISKTLKESMTLIASPDDNQDLIIGFIVFESMPEHLKILDSHSIIHFAYVKAVYRKLGVGKKLVNSVTKSQKLDLVTSKLWAHHSRSYIYAPELRRF